MKFPAVLSRIAAAIRPKAFSAVPGTGGWFGVIRESYSGAFQANVEVDAPRDLLGFSGIFAPLTLIASDVAKLRPRVVDEDGNGICTEARNSPHQNVLRRPNHYQNRIQFISQWMLSKLIHGNAYALKERDARGIVVALYLLDPQRVKPLVTELGDVYYELAADHLSGLRGTITVPALEIIHDRMNCLWHPLVGISPLYAAALSATQGRKIQANSSTFFQNMSRPSGMLTSPDTIPDETALRLKGEWEQNFSGGNMGRVAVAGNGLKYEAMTIPAEQAQLIEQLEWTVRDIAACFHMPLFKVGGPVPANNTVEALNQQYYSDCLQSLIESAELCLDEGLALPVGKYVEFDLDGLLRMDTGAHVKALKDAVEGALMAPNEARRKLNLPPLDGGDTIYMQEQNFSLQALSRRDAMADPWASRSAKAPATPAPPPAPEKTATKSTDIDTISVIQQIAYAVARETLFHDDVEDVHQVREEQAA